MSVGSSHDVRAKNRADQIRRIIRGYAQRHEADGPVSRDSAVTQYPELMPELGEELEKLRRIQNVLDEVEETRYEQALERMAGERMDHSAGDEFEIGYDESSGNGEDGDGADGEPMPSMIGRYRIRHLLGEGAFGRVYLAGDEELAREVAVKVARAYQAADSQTVEAFLDEARTVARLDHPSIVPIYDIGRTTDGCCYVVSKWIRGSDLQLRMHREKLPEREAVRIVMAVADALEYAHQRGLVHRDVKPANILLDDHGTPYLGDFGLALSGSRSEEGRSFAGTPTYMSPEQARGEAHRVDGRSDVFSLGVVLYELVAGHKPFFSELHEELLRQILWAEPVPLCQHNASIAPELERICLKSLSKRAADRYRTAQEMADDLRHYLDLSAGKRILQPLTQSDGSPPVLARSAAQPTPPRIVPRGLRPFDSCDSMSFLPLVPGPRDRDGLPESIRQWKTRIEQEDPEESFAVGVMYGPSGCGKSSLVRAGLLPRIATHVHTVYIEATADRTESQILKKLLRRYPELPAGGGLVGCLAALRRGSGPAEGSKLLFVVDQFEQWLHGRSEADRRLLVQALRHCDGTRLQCLLLVRDDFWLALSRFMTELEIDLVQSHNSALVDLFDPDHAYKVLAELGRAFGQLPEDLSRLTTSREVFLQRAIEGLTHEDKVVPVRLALFAEMVKAKRWSPSTLRDIGGAAGVGVAFLEETFCARTANPQYRLHEQAARAVLEALLPEAGRDMKGQVRSNAELLDLSGYGHRPRAFKELIRILDSQTRLITPADPEVVGPEEAIAGRGKRFYQLTHDYLVPSLRQWLTKKRRSTRAGRSELRLASRSAMWSATGERRQLPSLWEWIGIRLLTRSSHWTERERKMMRSTIKHQALAAGFLSLIVLTFLFGGLELTGMARDMLMRFRARSAAVWMAVGNEKAVWPLLKSTPDPTQRTRVVHGLNPVVADPVSLLGHIDDQDDVSIRRAMLLIAGELLGEPSTRFDTRTGLRPNVLPQDAIDQLLGRYRNDPDPGIHAAAEWILQKCDPNGRIDRPTRSLVSSGPRGDRQWYLNGQGHTMVVVAGPARFLMGAIEDAASTQSDPRPHYQRIRRSFSIAATETTEEQFRKFLDDNPWAEHEPSLSSDSTPDRPQASVTWYQAAAYCNWLSQSDDLPKEEWCYLPNDLGEYAAGMRLADNYLDRRGYRLPTEPEWEYACRAGATTAYSFGTDASYLKHYGVYGEISEGRSWAVGTRKPNDFGLFDMHGNLAEWCQDRYAPYPEAENDSLTGLTDHGPTDHDLPDHGLPLADSVKRVLRGGSFLDRAESVHSAARNKAFPNERRREIGFRVVRGYP